MLKSNTTNAFHNPQRVSNIFFAIPPTIIFTLLTICIYLSSWVLMLSVFRYTFSYTLFTHMKYSFDYTIAFLTISQVLGMLSNWFIVKANVRLTKSILIISLLCLLGSTLLFVLQQQYILYMLLILFFLFGQYVASATLLFHKYVPKVKRFHSIGVVLVSNAIVSFIIRSFSMKVSLTALFELCFLATLIVTILSIFLNSCPLPEPNVHIISLRKMELNKVYYHLLIYVSSISFIKGFLFQSIPIQFLQYSSFASASLSIGYILCIVIFTKFMHKWHVGISIYITNSIFLFAFICFTSFTSINWLSVLFAATIYATFALNDLFCFDTLFTLGEKFTDSSNIFGIGFSMYIFSIFLGQITAAYIHKLYFPQYELLIIIIYSIASLVLPLLRLEITKLLPNSIFHVDSTQFEFEDDCIDIKSTELATSYEFASKTDDQADAINELLSQRENEVLHLLMMGYPNDLIASTLFISNNTLKKHIQNIYNKLGVHSRSELFVLLKPKA